MNIIQIILISSSKFIKFLYPNRAETGTATTLTIQNITANSFNNNIIFLPHIYIVTYI